MDDKLKKFIETNRQAFDAFEPSQDLWQDIDRVLGQEKQAKAGWFQPRVLWRYAAAVVLLIGMGYGLIEYGRHVEKSHYQASQSIPLEKIAPEMAEVEAYYLSVINQKKQERSAYDLRELGLDKDFRGELTKLDSTYAQLKSELMTNPNKQPVIDAMVQNLQIRIGILNQQLEVLNQIKQVKLKTKNENVTI